jgi:rSAM/selenodomain-associated transferase 1
MARPALFIFTRAPAHGTVKTRLARDIGALEALRFHRQALAACVRQFGTWPRVEVILAVTPSARLDAAAWPKGIVRVDQGRGDLGQRMLRTLRRAGHRPALLIGSDIPDARRHHVTEALVRLARAPYVLGPTEDGGYWLIGARRPWLLNERLLDGVRWSSPHALEDTRLRLPGAVSLAQTLWDVDDGASWSRLKPGQGSSKAVEV